MPGKQMRVRCRRDGPCSAAYPAAGLFLKRCTVFGGLNASFASNCLARRAVAATTCVLIAAFIIKLRY